MGILILIILGVFLEWRNMNHVSEDGNDGLFHEINLKGLPPNAPWVDLTTTHTF